LDYKEYIDARIIPGRAYHFKRLYEGKTCEETALVLPLETDRTKEEQEYLWKTT
jgi:hypothetical protein